MAIPRHGYIFLVDKQLENLVSSEEEHYNMKNITEPLQDAPSTAHQNATSLEFSVEAAIDVMNLVKRYPKAKSKAVDGISFMVRRGEIFGLLGPNGAGKTTTISILTTGAMPTEGTVRIMGIDVVANPVRARQRLALRAECGKLTTSLCRARTCLSRNLSS